MTDLSPHDAYRRGFCIDCKARPYSAGRPRCEGCYEAHVPRLEPGLTRRPPKEMKKR